jgi:TolB-like protein
MTENNKKTIAVVEFSDQRGNVTDLGRFLSEELITRLYQTKKFRVIERQLLNRVIVEQKLTLSRLVDPASAKKLGKVLGVDAICSGSISELAQSIRVNARLINTETGEVFSVASVEVLKDESVTMLLGAEPPKQPQETKKPPKGGRVQEKGFAFELVGASRNASGTVVVEILITNISETQQDLSLYAKDNKTNVTRLFDVNGTEYWTSKLKFGPEQSSGEIRKTLPVGVPSKAIFDFDDIPEAVTNFTALDVGVVTDFWKYNLWRVQLKNLSTK